MPHFFISYAKKDTRELALALADALNTLENVTAWVDRSLRAGQSWERQIETEIDKCDFMIVLYSPDINRHKQGEEESYVLTEIAYAQYTAKKPIIPVMAQKTTAPISLTRAHYIDFTLSGLKLDDLIEAVCSEAGIAVGTTPPSSATTPMPARKLSSIDILPQPFAWIDIPAGKVVVDGETKTVSPFQIAKYPTTNAQFAKFIEADGYNQRKWWTDAGWEAKLKGWAWNSNKHEWVVTNQAWAEPGYWNHSKFNGTEQPIHSVSWYEAVAFCLWLSETTSEKIMLPTEDQWQYAAQGDEGRIYPWGNEWDCKRCNNSVKPCDGDVTTSVRQYEGMGDSPFGVVDMTGNVVEWCLTDYDNKTNDVNGKAISRVLRGGSRSHNIDHDFRTDLRSSLNPLNRFAIIGFRIARS